MNKLITAIVATPLILIGVMPPVSVPIPFNDSKLWLWLVLLCGFLGFATLYMKCAWYIKAAAIYGFINTFFTSMPFMSQWGYVGLISCIYYYYACLKIDDMKPILKILWLVLGLNLFMVFMQSIHKDILLNFGLKEYTCSGIIGNAMQFKSFLIVLIALILSCYKLHEDWVVLIRFILIAFCVVYFFNHQVLQKFLTNRGPVYLEAIRLSFERPIFGWGMGSFKTLFPAMGKIPFLASLEGIWGTCHNDFIQVFFETGIIGLGIFMAMIQNMLKSKGAALIAVCMVIFTLTFHMPMRTFGCIPFLVLFMALREKETYGFR